MKRPRLWETTANVGANTQEIAFHLGMSVTRFGELRTKLEAEGMPRPDPITETWCVPAIDACCLARHSMSDQDDTRLSERIANWRVRRRERPSKK